MQISLLGLNPPPSNVEVVNTYISKPLIVETAVTVDTPPRYSRSDGYAEKLYEDSTNCCVCWVKKVTGINYTLGNGARLAVNHTEPKVGAIGSLKGVIHAVVVESVNDGMITFKESNYTEGWITRRTLPESSFIGYIY